MEPLVLTSFRGGLNDTDPESDIAPDQLVVCQNIDLDQAPLGAKVYGSSAAANSFAAATDKCVFLTRYLPTNAQADQRLFAIATSGTIASGMWRSMPTGWTGTPFIDNLAVTSGQYHIQGKSIHGKLHLAYPSEGMIDRLHVWQSSDTGVENTIRRSGIAAPGVPTIEDYDTENAAFVQYAELLNTVSPAAKAFTNPVAANSRIIVSAIWNSAATPTVTDSQGNTYTLRQAQSISNFGANDQMGVWTLTRTAAGALTVTITEGGGSFFNLLDIKEVSGISYDANPVDTDASTSSNAASPATITTAAMSQEDGFVHALVASQLRDLTVGSGYTVRHDGSSTTPYWHLTEDKVVTSGGGAQTATATFTGANEWGIIALILKTGGGERMDTQTRYYRVRACRKLAGVIVRRSEPSASVSFGPSGVDGGVKITVPAASAELTNEGVNYFEIEASLDNANFYRINDSTGVHGEWVSGAGEPGSIWADYVPAVPDFGADDPLSDTVAVGYASHGILSPDIGDYTTIHAPKFLVADEDRLIYIGSWYQPNKASRVGWTPVYGAPGVGNDERLELDTDPFLDLDGQEGGEVTGATDPVNGVFYVFKTSAVYKVLRTNQRAKAYVAHRITDQRGAIEGSVSTGLDEGGRPCVYFADPMYGPCRVGHNGVEDCAGDIQTFWKTVNKDASVVSRSIFDPNTKQWHLCVAVGDSQQTPNRKLRLHTKQCRRTDQGVRRGWAVDTNDSSAVLTWCLYPEVFGFQRTLLTPTYGRLRGSGSAADQIHQINYGSRTDASAALAVTTYKARVKTKVFTLGRLLRKFGVTKAALLLTNYHGEFDYDIQIILARLVRAGAEETATFSTTVDIRSSAGRPTLWLMDQVRLSELYALQVEISDTSATPAADASWGIHALTLPLRDEGEIG